MEPIIFRCMCPVLNCPNENIIYWEHSSCPNSEETLDQNGDVKCEECGTKDFILNWKFSCGEHQNGYQFPDKAKALKVIGALVNIMQNEEDIAFLMKVCKRIRDRK